MLDTQAHTCLPPLPSPHNHTPHAPCTLQPTRLPPATHPPTPRRSAWICIDTAARRSFLHADKRSLITQLGLNIPIRDMRLLDFNLLTSETGKILVRDNAILFSIEHVRLIIAADKALVPRDGYEHNPLRCVGGGGGWEGGEGVRGGHTQCVGGGGREVGGPELGAGTATAPAVTRRFHHPPPQPTHTRSNRFVDILEESVADWRRHLPAHSAALSIDGAAQSDWDDEHSSDLGGWVGGQWIGRRSLVGMTRA